MKFHTRKGPLGFALAAGVIAFASIGTASAQQVTPNFDSAGVSYVHFDFVNDSINGFGFDIEKSISEDWFVAVDYVNGSESFGASFGGEPSSFTLDFSVLTANLGYKFYQSNTVTGYASAGLASFYTKAGLTINQEYVSDSDTDNAFNAQIGVRQMVSSQIEVDANFRHIEYSDGEEQQLSIGGRYAVNEQFVIGVGYTYSSTDFTYFNVSARYRF